MTSFHLTSQMYGNSFEVWVGSKTSSPYYLVDFEHVERRWNHLQHSPRTRFFNTQGGVYRLPSFILEVWARGKSSPVRIEGDDCTVPLCSNKSGH